MLHTLYSSSESPFEVWNRSQGCQGGCGSRLTYDLLKYFVRDHAHDSAEPVGEADSGLNVLALGGCVEDVDIAELEDHLGACVLSRQVRGLAKLLDPVLGQMSCLCHLSKSI